MTTRSSNGLVRQLAILAGLALSSSRLPAQFLGLNIRGDVGVKSGTQPFPGVYVLLPLFYRADYEGVRDASGQTVAGGLRFKLNFLVAPGVAVVTGVKVLDGNYGAQILFPFSSTRLALASPDLSLSSGYGFTDMYVQPINLGWHIPRADFIAGYAAFIPTGETDHSLDMWAHELSAGSTVYLDSARTWHVAATAFYDIHQKKQGQDLRVGDILTVEGGAGMSFLKGTASAGVAWVAQWKLTNDSGSDFPSGLEKSKSRVFGLGPDLTLPLFATGPYAGLLTLRSVWEFGGRTTFEGRSFLASLTFARLDLP